MGNNARDRAAQEERFADIFTRLREQDIEQFYAHYQLWVLRKRVPLIELQIETMREHLAEHQLVTAELQPSALALAVLVRLQSNGVSDTEILDLMLERGEDWLDRMMQRLDYCEQVQDFIQGDYTQWCVKSLDGAYDWIDSLLGSIKEGTLSHENAANDSEATEELLLHKLSLDDEKTMLEFTLKQSVTLPEAEPESSNQNAVESIPTEQQEQPSLLTEDLPEPSVNDIPEQSPELFGWKDLEDLEAPESLPVPWYSVNVTESGSSSPANDAGQINSMNDWIQFLQTDAGEKAETDETQAITENTLAMLITTDQTTTTEADIPVALTESAETDKPDNGTDLDVNTDIASDTIQTLDHDTEIVANEPDVNTDIASDTIQTLDHDTEIAALEAEPYVQVEEEALVVEISNEQNQIPQAETQMEEKRSDEAPALEIADSAQVAHGTPATSEPSPLTDDKVETADEVVTVDETAQHFDISEKQTEIISAVNLVSEAETETPEEATNSTQSILDPIEGSDEQAPWYEYLAIKNPASQGEEQSKPEILFAQKSATNEVAEETIAIIPTDLNMPTGQFTDETHVETPPDALTDTAGSPEQSGTSSNKTQVEILQEYVQPERPALASETTIVESTTSVAYQQTGAGEESSVEVLVRRISVQPPAEKPLPVQPVISDEKPPKKPGFWRRLFSFGRNKQKR